MRSSYTITFERDETGWWVAQAKEAPGAITQGRTLAEARRHIREALGALFDDMDRAKEVRLVDEVKLPAEARRQLSMAKAARERAQIQNTRANVATAATVRFLTGSVGLSTRDAGELLGLSHQRVQQLSHAPT